MADYLDVNLRYWSKGYYAPNVDHPAFRFYGRILRAEFNMSGAGHEALLDFGCGQGAAVNFFHMQGFEAFGVDVSLADITAAKHRYPCIEDHFAIIEARPKEDDVFFNRGFDVIIAIQSLYYLSNADLRKRLESLYRGLRPGGVFFATMMGSQCYFFQFSEEAGDGLSKVSFKTGRLQVQEHYINFTSNEEDLIRKFGMFKPKHVGFYSEKFRSDEGAGFHYTFVGVKE